MLNYTSPIHFMILGIETSCDDSAVAILDMDDTIIANEISSQTDLHDQYGGVVPELASRKHLTTLPLLLSFVFDKFHIRPQDLKAIAVTNAPGLIGSLLVGVSYAKTLSWVYGCPLIPVDHLEGHLLAPFLNHTDLQFPYLGLIASGGHTHLIEAKALGQYRLLGKTIDDAAGEAFDKVAKMLGFQYPGGPIVDQIASQYLTPTIEFPIPLKGQKTLNFSFSGLKTAVRKEAIRQNVYVEKKKLMGYSEFETMEDKTRQEKIRNIVASFQRIMCKIVQLRFKEALEKSGLSQFAISGGVASNTGIRRALRDLATRQRKRLFYPDRKNCTDNAAMIAYTALQYYNNGERGSADYLRLNASPKSPLGMLEIDKETD